MTGIAKSMDEVWLIPTAHIKVKQLENLSAYDVLVERNGLLVDHNRDYDGLEEDVCEASTGCANAQKITIVVLSLPDSDQF